MLKKATKSGQRITFFKISASGIESVTMAVMNAKAVPREAPFPIIASITGITLTELA